ncbi:MAG: hypothetical protein ACREAX_04225, partial [Candidatus Nitrosotenuis sp.]
TPYSHSITPRLEYCAYLVKVILERLQKEHHSLQKTNIESYSKNEDLIKNTDFKKQIEIEASLSCAIGALKAAKSRLESISQIDNIATAISPLISIIRMINSNIYANMPHSSHDLIELSTTLGSIVMDSGSLVEAKFDFKQTNLESTRILAEVNLIVESKIRTQYPNLNF